MAANRELIAGERFCVKAHAGQIVRASAENSKRVFVGDADVKIGGGMYLCPGDWLFLPTSAPLYVASAPGQLVTHELVRRQGPIGSDHGSK